MKKAPRSRATFASLILTGSIVSLLAGHSASAATLYWDTDGATAGFGNIDGTWGVDSFWSTSPAGTLSTANTITTATDDIFFGTGSLGYLGGRTVTVNGTQNARLITIGSASESVTFSGGTIALGSGGGITVEAGTLNNATISSNVTISGLNTFTVGASRTLAFDTGTFTRNAGATLSIQGAGTVTSSMTGLSNDGTGIIGAWAFQGTGTGIRYAVNTGGTLGGYTGGTAATDANSFAGATTNYDFSATGTTTLSASRTANTVRYTGTGNTIDLGASGANTFTVNGILAAGASGTLTIQRTGGTGTVVVGSSNELVIAGPQNVTINTAITAGAGRSLTYAGTGTLTISAAGGSSATTFTGNLNINSGTFTNLTTQAQPNAIDVTTFVAAGATYNWQGAFGAGISATKAWTVNGSFAKTGNGGATFSSTAPISGTGAFAFGSGDFTITLNGNNSNFTGAFSEASSNGTGVILGHNGALGAGTWTTSGSAPYSSTINFVNSNATLLTFAADKTFQGSNNMNLGTGAVTLSGANRTLTVTGITLTLGGAIGQDVAGRQLTKAGTGTLVLTGTGSTYSGATVINAGTLDLGGGTASGSLASPTLTLAGGSFNFSRTGNATQSFTATNLNSMASSISVAAGNTLNMGLVSRAAGVTRDLSSGTATLAALATSNSNGIMRGFTVGDSWAVANGVDTAITGLADGSYTLTSTAGTTASNYTNNNIDVNSSEGVLAGAITPNSVRFSSAAANTLTLTGTNTFNAGILVGSGVGNNVSTITGGSLRGPASSDLIIVQNNTSAGLTISSTIVNNTATSITKAGAGLLTLSGTNTFTGGLVINAGAVALGSTGALNSTAGSENAVTFNAASTGTLRLAGNSVVIRSLDSNALLGTPFVENASSTAATLTVGNSGNANSTFGGVIQDGSGGGALALRKSGTGTLTLSGTNTYTGGTILSAGTLSISANSNLGAAATAITVNGSSRINSTAAANVDYTRAIALSAGVTLSLQNTTATTATFSGAITGTGGITTINGANGNTIALTNANNTFTGDLTLPSTQGNANEIVSFASIGDGGVISLGKPGWRGHVQYTGSTNIAFNTRQISINSGFGGSPFDGGGVVPVNLFESAGSGTVTFNTNLVIAAGRTGTFFFGGANTGDNTFAGIIPNSSGGTLSIGKYGAGKWIFSGANVYAGSTNVNQGILEVTSLADGGSASSLGISSNAAANLILSGGTLRYTGGAVSTDRLFSLQVSSSIDASGTGAVNFTNTGAMGFNGGTAGKTLTLTGSNTGDNTLAASIGDNTGATSLAKTGIGTWVLGATNGFTGTTSLSGGGKLVLDYGTNNTTKLADGAALTLGGGTLTLKGGSHTEIVSATSLNAGGTSVTRDTGTGLLRLNAITRAAGGTISFADATIANTDTNNFGTSGANGILGGWATVGDNWAVSANTGSADTAITALSTYTNFVTTGGVSTTNYQLTGASTLAGGVAAGSLRISNNADDQALALGSNNLTITSTSATALGGILYAGGNNNNYTISGSGRIVTSTTNQELIFNAYTGTLTVNAFVGASGSSGPVTKSGAGTLVLGAANNYTGATRVNEGVLRLTNSAGAGAVSGAITVQNGAALELADTVAVGAKALTITGSGVSSGGALRNLAGSTASYAGAITVGTSGARINSDAGGSLTLTGGIATSTLNNVTFGGAGNTTVSTVAITGAGGLTKDGAGTLNVNVASTYTGTTTVSGGTMKVSGNLSATTALAVNNGGTFNLGAVNSLNSNATVGLGTGSGATSGGTLQVSDNLGTNTSSFTNSFGALSLGFNSTIDFGTSTGGGVKLLFAGVGTRAGGTTLSITNWDGVASTQGSDSTDRLIFTGSTTAFTSVYGQSDVLFNGVAGYTTFDLGNGTYEIVAIPEPSTWAAFGLAIGLVAYRKRRSVARAPRI